MEEVERQGEEEELKNQREGQHEEGWGTDENQRTGAEGKKEEEGGGHHVLDEEAVLVLLLQLEDIHRLDQEYTPQQDQEEEVLIYWLSSEHQMIHR